MRHYDIPYVPRGPANYHPPIPLEEMTLSEIKKHHIKTCAKANGDITVCSTKCKSPCQEGKRAMELANEVPLYDGKTLIERAKEENMKRKEDDWWQKSLDSGNQIEWLMKKFDITELQAKRKVYAYRYKNGLTDKTYLKSKKDYLHPKKEEKEETSPFESKMEQLMNAQELQKKVMDQCFQNYEAAKAKYEEIKKKVDILCSAVDILNDI